ncbi:MAG TPA: hypothetical protein VJ728_08660 [Candidatus Binataceae bacterium]|nr:hypothetical protein [Candidatus Binataceae bacterium]
MDTVKSRFTAIFLGIAAILICWATAVCAQSTGLAPAADNRAAEHQPDETKSLTEVNKELSNPISSIWSLTFQQNTYWLTMPDSHSERNQVNLQFQPVLPVALTPNWNLINRPVLQPLNSTPYINRNGHLHRVTGFGDTVFVTMLSPTDKLVGNWLFAAGPTFIFPTASNSRLGQNKWQLGPAGVVGYLGEKFLIGVFPQQWWSVGGPGNNTTSQLNLQYFASYFFAKGYSIGFSPNMLVNWYANKSSNMVTFPIGLSLSKVQRLGILPVRFGVQGQYMPVHPDVFGQKWNVQVVIAPVIPKLIKGNLLE